MWKSLTIYPQLFQIISARWFSRLIKVLLSLSSWSDAGMADIYCKPTDRALEVNWLLTFVS